MNRREIEENLPLLEFYYEDVVRELAPDDAGAAQAVAARGARRVHAAAQPDEDGPPPGERHRGH